MESSIYDCLCVCESKRNSPFDPVNDAEMDALAQESRRARKRKEREEAKAAAGPAGRARDEARRLEQQRVESYVQAEAAAQEERAKKLVGAAAAMHRLHQVRPRGAAAQPSVASSGATSLAGSRRLARAAAAAARPWAEAASMSA